MVLALDVQVCDQDEPADDGLVPDAGFARIRAANPNELWVTDITESGIPAGKVYLPPVIDRYDGMPSPERVCYRCERPFRQRSPTKRHRPLAIRDTPSYRKCREGSESGPSRHFGIWLVEVSQSQPQTDWKRRWSVNFHTVSCSRRSSESRLTVLHCVAYASIQISNASARFASSSC